MPAPPARQSSQRRRTLIFRACSGRAAIVRLQGCESAHKRFRKCLVQCIRRTAGGVVGITAISLFALSITIMSLYFSPFNVSIAMSVGFLVVGVSYAVAGTRMANLLTLGSGLRSLDLARSQQKKLVRIARHSKEGSSESQSSSQGSALLQMVNGSRRMKHSHRRAHKGRFMSRYGHSGGDYWGADEDKVVLGSIDENSTSRSPQESKIISIIDNGGSLTSITDIENSSFGADESAPAPSSVPRSVTCAPGSIIHSSVKRARLQMKFICQCLRKRLLPETDGFDLETESHSTEANLLVVAAQIRSMAHFIVWYALTNWRILLVRSTLRVPYQECSSVLLRRLNLIFFTVPHFFLVLRVDARRVCVVLSVSGIAYGLCRPSPSPAYSTQNNLPIGWSGQVPYFCICMTLNATGFRICEYLCFWINHRLRKTVGRETSPAEGRRETRGLQLNRQKKSRLSWFKRRRSREVAPSS